MHQKAIAYLVDTTWHKQAGLRNNRICLTVLQEELLPRDLQKKISNFNHLTLSQKNNPGPILELLQPVKSPTLPVEDRVHIDGKRPLKPAKKRARSQETTQEETVHPQAKRLKNSQVVDTTSKL